METIEQKMRNGTFNIVYKSVTKNYKKKGSKWKKRRIKSYAGLQGQVQDPNLNACNLLSFMHVDNNRSSYKKRRRREYAIRFNKTHAYNPTPSTKPNHLWSVHKQGDWVVEWVFE